MELFGNYIDTPYLLLWALVMGAVFYTYKEHGRNQYNEGMSDAICMHHTGTLKYDVILNEDGEEDLEIKINGG
jgi:hypothetical protein|tara:strand:+ start:288 stop:506 length:219 start_codon:yes stop_codon:yes gene_type:complete